MNKSTSDTSEHLYLGFSGRDWFGPCDPSPSFIELYIKLFYCGPKSPFWLRQELKKSQCPFVRSVQTCLELSIFIILMAQVSFSSFSYFVEQTEPKILRLVFKIFFCPQIFPRLRHGCYLLNIADKISVTLPQFNLDKVLSHPSHLLRIRVPALWLVNAPHPWTLIGWFLLTQIFRAK